MIVTRVLITSLLILAFASVGSAAQSDSRRSAPALVVDSFSHATRDGRWSDAARFLDLEHVARSRDEAVAQLTRPQARRSLTVEDLLRADPRMPREVAEYQVRQANEARADFDELQSTYARVASVDELKRLDPIEVAARYLEARDLRWQSRLALERERRRGCVIADSAFIEFERMRPNPVRIIGSVIDDSVAYVLHEELPAPEDSARARRRLERRRTARRATIVMPPRLTVLRLAPGGWRILPGLDWVAGVSFVSAQCERMPLGTPPVRRPSSP